MSTDIYITFVSNTNGARQGVRASAVPRAGERVELMPIPGSGDSNRIVGTVEYVSWTRNAHAELVALVYVR